MFQTSAFGQTYASVGDPSVGASIYAAAKQEVDFARMVERQKLNLQKRQLRMQEAQMEANRQAQQQNYELAQSRFKLEQKRLDNDFAIRQEERDMAERRYELALEEQRQRTRRQAQLDAEARAQRRLDNDYRERQFQASEEDRLRGRDLQQQQLDMTQQQREWDNAFREKQAQLNEQDREERRNMAWLQNMDNNDYRERQFQANENARRESLELQQKRLEQDAAEQKARQERQAKLDEERSAQWKAEYDLRQGQIQATRDAAVRSERNSLRQMGARELREGEQHKAGTEIPYEGADGKRYALPKKAIEMKAKKGTSSELAVTRVSQMMKEVDGAIKEYGKEDDGRGRLNYLLEEADATDREKAAVEKLVKENTDAKGKVNYGPALQEARTLVWEKNGYRQQADKRWEQMELNRQRGVTMLKKYKVTALENHELIKAIPPSMLLASDVDWGRMPSDTIDMFDKYLENGVFDDDLTNKMIMERLKSGKKDAEKALLRARKEDKDEWERELKRRERTHRQAEEEGKAELEREQKEKEIKAKSERYKSPEEAVITPYRFF